MIGEQGREWRGRTAREFGEGERGRGEESEGRGKGLRRESVGEEVLKEGKNEG